MTQFRTFERGSIDNEFLKVNEDGNITFTRSLWKLPTVFNKNHYLVCWSHSEAILVFTA